jgi:Flp pilus assembly pilin Flp
MLILGLTSRIAPDGPGHPKNKTLKTKGRRGKMELLTKMYVMVREFRKGLSKGQTMTEYALILAAVAIVVFVTYETMGQDIGSLVNKIDTSLTTAS